MSLDGARFVARAVQDDWDLRMQAHDKRVSGHDDVRIDAEQHTAAWLRAGMLTLEAPVEIIGTFFPDLGLFRWWWSGKEHSVHHVPARLDEAFAHAQRADLKELLTRQHQLDSEEDAAMLSRLAAYFGKATAMLVHHEGDRVTYFAVFAANTRAPIIPDREIVRTLPPPAVAQKHPTTPLEVEVIQTIREPSRALILPVVHMAYSMVREEFQNRVHTALLVVNVDTSRDKARYFVTLVVNTDDGDLFALHTTKDLLDATAAMLIDDVRSGNGRWRKLVVRIDPEGEGAAIGRIEVTA